jgi:hypothetical protein
MQEENWKDIPNYEGLYQVSNLGVVKNNKGTLIKSFINHNGYFRVNLCKNGVKRNFRNHQLVAMAFLNHIPDGTHKLVVDHINNIKTDNNIENLQIITQRKNARKLQGSYTSKYKGVCWHKKSRKWYSRIHINGKNINLGFFDCELKAHLVYQNKLKEIV